jgi:hypothetical protein
MATALLAWLLGAAVEPVRRASSAEQCVLPQEAVHGFQIARLVLLVPLEVNDGMRPLSIPYDPRRRQRCH